MTVRTVTLELEARLKGGGGGLFSKPAGKVERKSYQDGGERLKVSARNIDAPEGSEATVLANGSEILRLALTSGVVRYDEERPAASALPALEAGQLIEVVVDGTVVLSGKLAVD